MTVKRDPLDYRTYPWFGKTDPDSDWYVAYTARMLKMGAGVGLLFGACAGLLTWIIR